jgi:Mn2+/Fe2+ NRAMP family transporter
VPHSFLEYLRFFGPGIVIVLTWLGAGDVVDMGVAGMPDFVTLTLLANSAQVVLLPLLAGGLWWITASARYIGREYRNRWWENVVMALLFVLAVYGAISSVMSILQFFRGS